MALNPEFQRNLWLELSLHRLVAMPLVLGIVFFFVFTVADDRAGSALAWVAQFLFVAIAWFWGAKVAGDSIGIEIQNRTWDWQRMSSISPWAMAWGKLLGSTIYAWYGGLICLAVFAVSSGGGPRVGKAVALLAASALTLQACALMFSLLLIRQRPGAQRKGGMLLVVLVVVPVFYFVAPALLTLLQADAVRWYDRDYGAVDFILASMLVFLAWSVVALHRLMRAELQFRNRPWVWLGFVVFLMAYAVGFPYAESVDRRLAAYAIALAATLLMVLLEPKDPVAWRALAGSVADRALDRASELTPRWLLTLVLAVALAVSLSAEPPAFSAWMPTRLGAPAVPILAALLLLLRDVGIVLWLSLGERVKRPEFTALIYLLLLYTVVPGTLVALGLAEWTSAFWPRPGVSAAAGLGPPAVEVAVVAALVHRRWSARFRRVPDRP